MAKTVGVVANEIIRIKDDSKFYHNLFRASLWICLAAWASFCTLLMLSVGKY